ncbi:MAG: hypothetical protein HY673_02355 [Chloroflexi bacterium]|nr:hypothetical protein [Chloroflexota bacterium]
MNKTPGVPEPRFPEIPENISLEHILPTIRVIAQRKHAGYEYPGLDVKPGKKYLILADSTNDPLVTRALALAVREGGGLVQTVVLEGYAGMTEPVDLLDTMFSTNWFPSWVWEAMAGMDVVIMSLFLLVVYTPNIPVDPRGKPKLVNLGLPRDLYLPECHSFPTAVKDALDKETWEMMVYARRIELTSLEGTDLTWTVTRERWEEGIRKDLATHGVGYYPGHLMIPLPSRDVEGRLVTGSITFGGPVPCTTLVIEEGKATSVEGEGKFADVLRRSFQEFRDARSVRLPGPGINWLTTMAMGTHPKGRPGRPWNKMSGSGRMRAWGAGHSRSGIIHTSVGEAVVSRDRRIIRHVNQFFSTLVADGKKIIDKGHLVTLDDPKVARIAEKYGDPAQLLREDWIPDLTAN